MQGLDALVPWQAVCEIAFLVGGAMHGTQWPIAHTGHEVVLRGTKRVDYGLLRYRVTDGRRGGLRVWTYRGQVQR